MKSKSAQYPQIAHIKIPHAKMQSPTSALEKLKYLFWFLYTPIHPFGRDLFLKLGIVKHDIRQPFLIGRIDIDTSLENVVRALLLAGYGNHFVAWRDNGEIVSLRYADNFEYQHHIRIFSDGEVRGHYEYTCECHPVWHTKEIGMENRSADFLKIIGAYIIADTASK
jgi:hypothetical protein